MHKFHVLIPAAGSGSRMQSELPKQYLNLLGYPIIQHTLNVFDQTDKIDAVHVLISPEDVAWQNLALKLSPKVQVHACGGQTRAETVLNGLKQIAQKVDEHDWILVHDAARPGLSTGLLEQMLQALEQHAVGGLLAIPVADTLKMADATEHVADTHPREGMWRAQTPQMFRFSMLKQALETFGSSATDEAQAIEKLGLKPKLIKGALRNLKITYPEDLQVIEAIFNNEHRGFESSNES